MLLPKGTRGAATAAGGRVASTSQADLLTRLVKQGVVQPQHPTCLNLSKSRLGDDDVLRAGGGHEQERKQEGANHGEHRARFRERAYRSQSAYHEGEGVRSGIAGAGASS